MTRRASLAAAGAVIGLALPIGVASASSDGGDIRKAGECNGNSTSKIKAKPDDGRLEVEFEVDQNRNGQKWKVKFKDNGSVVFRGTATTKAPSGSFSIERKIDNKTGNDRITAVGRNQVNGERCVAKVTI